MSIIVILCVGFNLFQYFFCMFETHQKGEIRGAEKYFHKCTIKFALWLKWLMELKSEIQRLPTHLKKTTATRKQTIGNSYSCQEDNPSSLGCSIFTQFSHHIIGKIIAGLQAVFLCMSVKTLK